MARPSSNKVTHASDQAVPMDIDHVGTTFKKKKLTDLEKQYLMENKGCFRCLRVNVNHLAKECKRDLFKYGYPKNALEGFQQWKAGRSQG